MSEGIIPYYKVGRLVFLDLEEVYEAIRCHGSQHRQTVDDTFDLKGGSDE